MSKNGGLVSFSSVVAEAPASPRFCEDYVMVPAQYKDFITTVDTVLKSGDNLEIKMDSKGLFRIYKVSKTIMN